MRTRLLISMICLAGCVSEPGRTEILPVVMEVPEGYPWKMGDGTVTQDGATRAYTTYDFSIGAFDASVQFRRDHDCSGQGACEDTGKFALSLVAYPDANPDAKADVMVVHGVFATLPDGPATTGAVTVEIRGPGRSDGKSLMSTGAADLTLTAVNRGRDGSDSYGTLSARVTATVCEAEGEALVAGGACHEVTATFMTEVQYDSV